MRVKTVWIIGAVVSWAAVIGVYWWVWCAYKTLRGLWIWVFS